MKTVKSVADLKQIALSRGATVELGTSRFNTTGQRIAAAPRKPEPKQEPKPEPVAAPAPAPVVNIDTAAVAQAQERVGQLLAQALASMPQPSAPVREWVFTIERDEKGLLTSIRATAQS